MHTGNSVKRSKFSEQWKGVFRYKYPDWLWQYPNFQFWLSNSLKSQKKVTFNFSTGIFVSWFYNPFNWNLRKRQCNSPVLLSGKKNSSGWKLWSPFPFEFHNAFPPEPLETVASGKKISLEIFRKHWKLPINTTEMKNAVCSQKNQESLREKSNGTEAAGA